MIRSLSIGLIQYKIMKKIVVSQKPIIYQSKAETPSDAKIIEAFTPSLEELFFIDNPQFKRTDPRSKEPLQKYLKNHNISDIWVYYPWKNIIVHLPEEIIFIKLKTARNKNIITENEQFKYRDLSVGIAGLSVGSAVVAALVISGGPKNMKIADYDVLELTNLNRLRANLLDIGSNKTDIVAKSVWEQDPFIELELWDKGLTKENIERFFLDPKLDVFVDEMDNIELKVFSRLIAKKSGIPVLMATDNGDGIIIDVERFDLEPEREIFHGLIKNFNPKSLESTDFKGWLKLAAQIISPDYLTQSMQDSLLEIGKSIAAVPQLGTSAGLAGSAISYVLRRISNGENIPSGRYTLSLEEVLIPDFNSKQSQEERKNKTESFKKNFGR